MLKPNTASGFKLSAPEPWNRDGGSGVFWPRATVNSPFVAVTLSVSV